MRKADLILNIAEVIEDSSIPINEIAGKVTNIISGTFEFAQPSFSPHLRRGERLDMFLAFSMKIFRLRKEKRSSLQIAKGIIADCRCVLKTRFSSKF